MNKNYIILGNGGHANVCRDVAKKTGFEEIGYVLEKQNSNSGSASDNDFLGSDEWLVQQTKAKPLLVNGIGGDPDSRIRSFIFNKYSALGFKFLTLIHPSAQIGENVSLGEGVQIMAGAIVQPNCSIASNSIINTRASIDHDCVIHEHVHIAPGALLCGRVVVGQGAFVGAHACIIPEITIGSHAIIGAGSTVRKDVKNGATFVGK